MIQSIPCEPRRLVECVGTLVFRKTLIATTTVYVRDAVAPLNQSYGFHEALKVIEAWLRDEVDSDLCRNACVAVEYDDLHSFACSRIFTDLATLFGAVDYKKTAASIVEAACRTHTWPCTVAEARWRMRMRKEVLALREVLPVPTEVELAMASIGMQAAWHDVRVRFHDRDDISIRELFKSADAYYARGIDCRTDPVARAVVAWSRGDLFYVDLANAIGT